MYLKAILVFLSLLLLAYLIYYLGFYKNWSYCCVGTISFESFKAMYAMNPDQWSLCDGYVEYNKYRMNGQFYESYISGRLGFSQRDAIKYQIWHQKHDKQKEQEYMTNRYKEILQELQNDIDTYKERNNVS